MFPKETVEGSPQLLSFVDELKFWLDLVGDGSEDWVRWRVLEEGKERGVKDRLGKRYNLSRGSVR